MRKEQSTSGRRLPHKNFRNGDFHDQNSGSGLPQGFSIVENGEHQRENGERTDQLKVVYDKKYLKKVSKKERAEIIKRAEETETRIRNKKK